MKRKKNTTKKTTKPKLTEPAYEMSLTTKGPRIMVDDGIRTNAEFFVLQKIDETQLISLKAMIDQSIEKRFESWAKERQAALEKHWEKMHVETKQDLASRQVEEQERRAAQDRHMSAVETYLSNLEMILKRPPSVRLSVMETP